MTTVAGNPVPAASVCAGSAQVPIQGFSVTGNGVGNNITAVGFTANGTWVSADISAFRLWTTTGNTFTSPTQIAVTNVPGTNTQTFSGFSISTKSTTVYFWITMDVTVAATDGHTLTVAAMTNVIGSNSGTAPASGTQTLRASVGGTATAAVSPICSGTAPTINLSGQTGSVGKWQYSSDNFASDVHDIANTTVTLNNAPTITATTYYRAVVSSGGCGSSNSSVATVTVSPASVGGTATATASPICSGSAPTINLSGQTGSVTKWQYSSDNFASDVHDVANTTVTLNNAPAITAPTYYRAVVTSGVCAPANSSVATVTVNTAPAITASPNNAVVCAGSTASFSVTATGAGLTYQWQVSTNGGTTYNDVSTGSGGTTATYTTATTVAGDNNNKYQCAVSGTCSPAATSSAAIMTVGSQLVFTTQPASTTAGAIMASIVVQIKDQAGNNVSFSGKPITLTLNGSTLYTGTNPQNTDASGKATFSDLVIRHSGNNLNFTASASGLTSATSGNFNIVPAAASQLVITSVAVTTTAGVASGNITVQRQDAFGNPNTTDANRTVTLSSSSSGIVTFTPTSPLTILNGSSTVAFTYTDTKAGMPTITAASAAPTTITSASQQETVTKATPSITSVTASQSINYGTATVTLTGTVSAPGPVFPANGETVNVTINGVTQSATVLGGAGGFSVNYPTATIPASASPYTITYAYAGDANLNAAANNTGTTLTVNKATPTITTSPTASPITYGQTLASSSLSGGVASVAGTFAFTTPSTAPSTGTSSQSVTFTPTDTANYNTVTTSVNVTVGKATPTITTAPTATAITYGQTLASSTLSGGVASVAGSFAFTTPSTAPSAGTASQSVTFTPTDTANYNTVTTSVSVTVAKATPTITTAPTATPITYGQTLASSTLSGGVASVAGNFAFTTPSTAPSAGTAPQSVTFTPTDTANYNNVTTSASVTVVKATPTITTAPTATPITYGQTLASSTLSGGVASVAGTFAFTTPSTAPSAGTASQSVTFTPTDTANYNNVTTSASVTVVKATPTITTVPTATAITYGQTLASSTLGGGVASVAGSFAFTTPSTAPSAGTASQSVTFTPTDTANYTTATTSANVTVGKATPTITTVPMATAITYGQTLASSTLSGGVASVAGTFAFTTPSTAPSIGTASQSVTFTPTDTANYNNATTSASVTVGKATPTITTPPTATAITYGQTLASSTLSGGVASVAGTFAFITPSTAPSAGTASQSVTFTPTDTANYNNATTSASVTVNQRPVQLTGSRSYDGTTRVSAVILSVANKVGSDVVTVVSGNGTLAGKNVGVQAISSFGNLTLGGGAAANYTMIGASGSVTMGGASLSITANNDTKAYGQTVTYGSGSTAFTSSGLQNGEVIGSVTVTASGGTASTDPVGSYTLMPGAATGGTFTPGNYNISYHGGTLQVVPGITASMTLYNYLGPTEIVVKFVAKDSGSNIVSQQEVALPATGASINFSLSLPANTATLSIKPRFYLRQKFDVAAALAGQNQVTLNFGTFTGGDVYEDNQVDATDYAWLRTCWGNSGPVYVINGSPVSDPSNFPDLNGDGIVDAKDYEILKNGWYQAGDDE
jgi:hypothetical protein